MSWPYLNETEMDERGYIKKLMQNQTELMQLMKHVAQKVEEVAGLKQNPDSCWMSVKEAAHKYKISRRSVSNYCSEYPIRRQRSGRMNLLHELDLMAALNHGSKKKRPENFDTTGKEP